MTTDRTTLTKTLQSCFGKELGEKIEKYFEEMVFRFRRSDFESVLTKSGKLAENVLIAIIEKGTGEKRSEIKNFKAAADQIKKIVSLPEPIRILIPGIASSLVYDIRSKKGAVHEKNIDPAQMDAHLAIQASSWLIAEFVRVYSSLSDAEIAEVVRQLVRVRVPLVEDIGGMTTIIENVPPKVEVCLLISTRSSNGISQAELTKLALCSQASVSKKLTELKKDRYIRKGTDDLYRITSSGERYLQSLALQSN
ncbi:MAG: hypothetical protein ACX930_03405 [Erythrobacter sp.]